MGRAAGVLRLSTRGGVFPRPLTLAESAGVVELWLAQPPAVVVHATQRHLGLIRGFLDDTGTGANVVNDAHLAVLAIEHGAEIVSFDRNFERFTGIRLTVPQG